MTYVNLRVLSASPELGTIGSRGGIGGGPAFGLGDSPSRARFSDIDDCVAVWTLSSLTSN